jgi:hypothetical protein
MNFFVSMKKHMIPDEKVLSIITEQYPDLHSCKGTAPFESFKHIAFYAKQFLKEDNYQEFKKINAFINKLYYHASGKIKLCIDNVYTYSVGTFIDTLDDQQRLRDLLPDRMSLLLADQHGASCI